MIEPGNSLGDRCNGRAIRCGWPPEHEYGDAKRSCRGNLAVRGISPAVLRNNGIYARRFEQFSIAVLRERPPREDVMCMRHIERRVHRINTADEIVMLWRAREWQQLLPPNSEKDTPRLLSQRTHSTLRVRNSYPEIAVRRRPGRSAQTKDRRGGARSSLCGVGRDGFGIRMRRIDQEVYALGTQIFGESLNSAKPTDPDGNRLHSGRCCSAGERDCRGELATGQRESKLASLRRTSQNQDVRAHVRQP